MSETAVCEVCGALAPLGVSDPSMALHRVWRPTLTPAQQAQHAYMLSDLAAHDRPTSEQIERVLNWRAKQPEVGAVPQLSPTHCICGRPAHFRYTSIEEAKRGTPICWAEQESDCPAWRPDGQG